MEIKNQKNYIEIDIPYEEIGEYVDLLEFLQFKKALNSIEISQKEANSLLEEINEGIRERSLKWLKEAGIEVDN